ncbi:unnamed protein product [Cyprideis torosa]|uniref:Uncharacterized protein n=1 Tax=Cyprideis torosa TaxID=163714 RepID=A0A7R8W2Z6_9CRUS|nr:unnamed protein product [Cyprideis torosa]CAG0880272.1 unnamed protein product [Cyprideis torosa]
MFTPQIRYCHVYVCMMSSSGENSDSKISRAQRRQNVIKLMKHFSKVAYRPKDDVAVEALQESLALFERDHECMILPNSKEELCSSYPSSIIIPISEKQRPNIRAPLSKEDLTVLQDTVSLSRTARCRSRFPMPVILYNGKYICRSATLAGGPEIYGRWTMDFFFGNAAAAASYARAREMTELESVRDYSDETQQALAREFLSVDELSPMAVPRERWVHMDQVRMADIRLLRLLGVTCIADCMVQKKFVKFNVYITSSEKIDKEGRYRNFQILATPYPGVEYFDQFQKKGYNAHVMKLNWFRQDVNVELDVPLHERCYRRLGVRWSEYRTWDMVMLTGNYLRLYLASIMDETKGGFLIHCISGWDRTPLFASLIRLSLWADGLIHCSLNALEIVHLTLAYDWYLFGHLLHHRLALKQEILFFNFYFLQFMTGSEFSINKRLRLPTPEVSVEALPSVMLMDQPPSATSSSCSSSVGSSQSSYASSAASASQISPGGGIPIMGKKGVTEEPASLCVGSSDLNDVDEERGKTEKSSAFVAGAYAGGGGSPRGSDDNYSVPSNETSPTKHEQDIPEEVVEGEQPVAETQRSSRSEALLEAWGVFYDIYESSIGIFGPHPQPASPSRGSGLLSTVLEKLGVK